MSTDGGSEQESNGNLLSKAVSFGRSLIGRKSSSENLNTGDRESPQAQIAALREQLGQDGHLAENTAALIVSQAALARSLAGNNVIDGMLDMVDAFAGKSSKLPPKIADRLTTLGMILDNHEIQGAAFFTGFNSSPNKRREIAEAEREGFSALREVVLKMETPSKPGEVRVSLGEKIRASTTPKT